MTEQDKIEKHLESFGKANQDILDTYEHVCSIRKAHTLSHLESRFNKKANVEKETSRFVKCGRLVKSLLILLAIACMVGPAIYSVYDQAVNTSVPTVKPPSRRGAMTPDEIREEAMEREKMQMDRQREQQREMGIEPEEPNQETEKPQPKKQEKVAEKKTEKKVEKKEKKEKKKEEKKSTKSTRVIDDDEDFDDVFI